MAASAAAVTTEMEKLKAENAELKLVIKHAHKFAEQYNGINAVLDIGDTYWECDCDWNDDDTIWNDKGSHQELSGRVIHFYC
jgi:hypothetical protein